jgi:hypothetical protein
MPHELQPSHASKMPPIKRRNVAPQGSPSTTPVKAQKTLEHYFTPPKLQTPIASVGEDDVITSTVEATGSSWSEDTEVVTIDEMVVNDGSSEDSVVLPGPQVQAALAETVRESGFDADGATSIESYALMTHPYGWTVGSPCPFIFLATFFDIISKTSSRILITHALTNMFRHILHHHPASLLAALYLTTGRISPSYLGEELGVGPAVLVASVAATSDKAVATIRKEYSKHGDFGDLAAWARGNGTRSLFRTFTAQSSTAAGTKFQSVASVFSTLKEIASMKGSGSIKQKTDLVKKMLIKCRPENSSHGLDEIR